MVASSPITISLRLDIVRAWHICGLWGHEKHLKVKSGNTFVTLILVRPAQERAAHSLALLGLSWLSGHLPAVPGPVCSSWLTPLLYARFASCLAWFRPMAETKGQQPRSCHPLWEDCPALQGRSPSRAFQQPDLRVSGQGLPGEVIHQEVREFGGGSWAHRAPGGNSSSDL